MSTIRNGSSQMKVLDTYIDHENVGRNGGDNTGNVSQLFIRSMALAFLHVMRSSHQKMSVEVLPTNVT